MRLPDGVACQAPGEHFVEGHRGQPRQGLEVLVELAAVQQYSVDIDKLPMRLDECRVQRDRSQQRRRRPLEPVPPQLDLPGQQGRRRGGRVVVRDPGELSERLVGVAQLPPPRPSESSLAG